MIEDRDIRKSVQYVKGVGPIKARLLENLGISIIEDILYFFPIRYEDRRKITDIAQLQIGKSQVIRGVVTKSVLRKNWKTRKGIIDVIVDDGGGCIVCTWFNQAYLKNWLRPGMEIVCYGKVDNFKNRLHMISPVFEVISKEEKKDSLNLNRIVPVYSLTRGITQNFLRKIIYYCLSLYGSSLEETLYKGLRDRYGLMPIVQSIRSMHFPETYVDSERSCYRVSFEEFYFFLICIFLRRLNITSRKGVSHSVTNETFLKFSEGLDFSLTDSQHKVIQDIYFDMKKLSPMLRLLQGDVGCGKTIVALFGCYMSLCSGKQSVIMAPTEILARQHFMNVKSLVEKGVLNNMRCAFLTGSLSAKEKADVYEKILAGEVDLVIGTHALIGENVKFKNLSYVVIDEQHKFGVRQRAILSQKGDNPDILVMTATPIPRTLCLTLYGDLDVSVIDEMPKGRGIVKSKGFASNEIEIVYNFVRSKVKEGRQAYFVYPIIEESEETDLKAASEIFRLFKNDVFKEFHVALIHGRLKKDNVNKIMDDFKSGKIDILVCTTVIEVGVDVANASVMVIEQAERFGLSTLHQLRGRIGRGRHNGYCCFVSDQTTEEGKKRLKAIISTSDGFKISEKDLEIRGPGRYFGRHQHGFNELKIANPVTQVNLLKKARKEAKVFIGSMPKGSKEDNKRVMGIIKQRYSTFLEDIEAG